MSDPIESAWPDEPDEDQTSWTEGDGKRYHLDLDDGTVYEATDDHEWVAVGSIPGTGGADGVAPSKVENVVLTPVASYGPDGITIVSVGIEVEWDAAPEADVVGYEVQVDAYDALFAVYATLWSGGTATTYQPAIAGHQYWVRVRAYDVEGLTGPWSDTETTTTLDDGTAPAIPSDVNVVPGYQLIGVTWTPNGEPDLDHYEVQFTDDVAGSPDLPDAKVLVVYGNSAIITGLVTGARYHARVRAVDTGGWVTTSDVVATPVKADTSPDAGWSPWDSDVTLLVGSSDLAVHELAAQFVNTGVLNADRVNTGVLTLGKVLTAGGVRVGVVVYDSLQRFIGWWNETGMLMVNPDNTVEAMWLTAGRLQFTDNLIGYSTAPAPPPASVLTATTWNTAISPLGINADAITFGSSQAGHNLIPNSGMELQAFSLTAESSLLYDTSAHWAAGTGLINLDTSTGDLKLSAL